MRTSGSGSSAMEVPPKKKRLKADTWTEDELDSLWIGVRRHGRGNWEALLQNPKLKFSKHRLPEDLSSKWAEEQLKILSGPSKITQSGSEFPPLSDGMMTRALFGSRFSGNFHSHLTDIQLGCGSSEKSTPLMMWQQEKALPSRVSADFDAGPSDRTPMVNKSPEKLNSGAKSLPHWLREAVGLQSTGPQKKLELPPTVSAIAKSVKVLYERESPIIPPFTIPGQLPSEPKDPNRHSKKRKAPNLNLMSRVPPPLPLQVVGSKEDEILLDEEGHCNEDGRLEKKGPRFDSRERKGKNVEESGVSGMKIDMENVFLGEDVVSKDNG